MIKITDEFTPSDSIQDRVSAISNDVYLARDEAIENLIKELGFKDYKDVYDQGFEIVINYGDVSEKSISSDPTVYTRTENYTIKLIKVVHSQQLQVKVNISID